MRTKLKSTLSILILFGCVYLYELVQRHGSQSKNQGVESGKVKKIESTTESLDHKPDIKPRVPDNLEKSRDIQDQVNADWSVSLLKFFTSKEMGMSLKDYYIFREEYAKSYFEAMDVFYEGLSDNESQNPTDDPPQIQELKNKYHQNLKDKLGKDDYELFLKMRDRFNESVFEKHPGVQYIEMEF